MGEQVRQDIPRRDVVGAEQQFPLALADHFLDLAFQVLDILEHRDRERVQGLPLLGQFQPGAAAAKKGKAQPLFELFDLHGDGRRRHVQPVGRRRHAPVAGRGVERAQLIEIHEHERCLPGSEVVPGRSRLGAGKDGGPRSGGAGPAAAWATCLQVVPALANFSKQSRGISP